MAAQSCLEARIDRRATDAVGGHEYRVPASGPPERRCGTLHVASSLGRRGIVGGGDGSLLRAKCIRRITPSGLDVLGVHSAECWQRVVDLLDRKHRRR